MSDFFDLDPASTLAGFAAGFAAGFTLGGFVYGLLLRWELRTSRSEPSPMTGGMLDAFAQDVPVLARRLPEPVETVQPKPLTIRVQRKGLWLDEVEGPQLARLIVEHGDEQGVKLTHRLMKRYGFTADARRADLLDQVIQRGKGFERHTTGGKVTVYLRPEVAARLVEKVRARGGYGGVRSPTPDTWGVPVLD